MTLLCSTLLCCAHQVSILQLLEPLLNRDHGANAARYADLQHFAAAIVRRFVATAKTNPNLFIEALFWKKYSVCVQLAIGYELAIASRWPLSFLPCEMCGCGAKDRRLRCQNDEPRNDPRQRQPQMLLHNRHPSSQQQLPSYLPATNRKTYTHNTNTHKRERDKVVV